MALASVRDGLSKGKTERPNPRGEGWQMILAGDAGGTETNIYSSIVF
jgi:hypothetical protein